VVAVNLSDRPTALRGVEGTIRIDTERGREGERVSGRLQLHPWQGVVLTG
jgi:hypothetical protein